MQLDVIPKPAIMHDPKKRMRVLLNHELLIIKKLVNNLPHNRASLGKIYLKTRQQLYLLDLISKKLKSNGKAVHLLHNDELKQNILPLAAYLINFSPRITTEEDKNFIRNNPTLLYTLWQKIGHDLRPVQKNSREHAAAPHKPEYTKTEKQLPVNNRSGYTQQPKQTQSPAYVKPLPKKKPLKKQNVRIFWGVICLLVIIFCMGYFTFAAVNATAFHFAPAFASEQKGLTTADPQSGTRQYIPLSGETVAGLYLTEPEINFCNKLVLTLDDIELNDNIDPILLTLSKYGIQAVFFIESSKLINGDNKPYAKSQELLHKILFYGHTLGNHSFGHPNYNKIMNSRNIARNLEKAEEVIETVLDFNYNLRYVRPPYGNRGQKNCIDHILKQKNQLLILWQIDSYDWKMNLGYSDNRHLSPQNVINNTLFKIKNSTGGVVLLHGFQHINTVLESIITETLKLRNNQGSYYFVPIEELLAIKYHNK